MKKLFLIFAAFVITTPAMAAVVTNNNVATTSYVHGAYDEMDNAKQDKLTSSNVVADANGSANGFVSAVTANNGTVTVTKSEITIPVGSANSATRAQIWVQ